MTAAAAALTLSACGRNPPSPGGEKLMAATQAAACVAPQTSVQIKQVLFDAVAALEPSSALAARALGAQSSVALRQAVLDSYDNLNDRTTCAGRLALVLPASASGLVAGDAAAPAPVRYTIQPSADGRSLVYGLNGADVLAGGLAHADLKGWAQRNAPAETAPASAAAFNVQTVLRGDRLLSGRLARVNEMLATAQVRDVSGKVRAEHNAALARLDLCPDKACIETWLRQREAVLGKWQE